MQSISDVDPSFFSIVGIHPESNLVGRILLAVNDINFADVIAGNEVQLSFVAGKGFYIGKNRVFSFRIMDLFHVSDLFQIGSIQISVGIQILQVAVLIKPGGGFSHPDHIGFNAGISHDTNENHEKNCNKL